MITDLYKTCGKATLIWGIVFLLAALEGVSQPKKGHRSGCHGKEGVSEGKTVATGDEKASQGHYGELIDEEGAWDMPTLLKKMEGKDSLMAVKVSGEIRATCQKKGCWMDLATGGDLPMKVRFKDYAFFVPRAGMEGKQAIVSGVVKRKMVGVGMLRHYAKDAGKSEEEIAAITEPQERLTFMATGVIIK